MHTMNALQALILGIVQGLTEFLPVSSSAHLVFVPALMRIPSGVAFDTLLHIGTLIAVVSYFWKDVTAMVKAFFLSLADIPAKKFGRGLREDPFKRLAWLVLIATIPAAVLGFLFQKFFTSLFQSVSAAALLLLVTGIVLWLADTARPGKKQAAGMTWVDGLIIGLAQAAAIAPGISRSGVTISAGLFRGLQRQMAARFSFLLSIPIILGAALVQFKAISAGFHISAAVSLAGFVSAIVCGWLAIRIMMKVIQKRSLRVFACYCWLAGGTFLALSLCHVI